MKFCIACGTSLPIEARFCGKCGAEVSPDPVTPVDTANVIASTIAPDMAPEIQPQAAAAPLVEPVAVALPPPPPPPVPPFVQTEHPSVVEQSTYLPNNEAEPRPNNMKYFVGGAVALLAVFGLLYYWLFLSDDVSSGGTPTVQATAKPEIAATEKTYYAMTQANIRDKATATGSNVVGKLPRGTAVTGTLALGEDGVSDWLKLADGEGFVGAVNLSETAPPQIVKALNDKIWVTDKLIEIWSQPGDTGTVLDRVAIGTKLTLAGLTANDYIEIKLQRGGVGYIADGARIIALASVTGKPITLSFNPDTCNFGGEIEALFAQMLKAQQSRRQAIEKRSFANDEARNAALDAFDLRDEGQSDYMKLQRSFNGLTITGIAQHYESQSVYFAEPKAKVTEVFRGLGFKVDNKGNIPSQDVYAGLDATSGSTKAYGQTDLGCGV